MSTFSWKMHRLDTVLVAIEFTTSLNLFQIAAIAEFMVRVGVCRKLANDDMENYQNKLSVGYVGIPTYSFLREYNFPLTSW